MRDIINIGFVDAVHFNPNSPETHPESTTISSFCVDSPVISDFSDRAAMLGHSIETNLKYYSFAQKDYLDNVRALLDSVTGDEPTVAQGTACPRGEGTAPAETQGTLGNPSNVINFQKRESPEHLNYQVF